MNELWRELVWPVIEGSDFTTVVDLAAGHGRNTAKLLPLAQRLYVVDLHEENIAVCRQRFGDDPWRHYLVNNGVDLAGVPDDAVSLVYSFDAMVHFDSDVVRGYLRETRRVLRPGGRGFFHHSNYIGNSGGFVDGGGNAGPGHRNFMHQALFAHYAAKEGLRVLRQHVIDWNHHPALDCLTLLERPAG